MGSPNSHMGSLGKTQQQTDIASIHLNNGQSSWRLVKVSVKKYDRRMTSYRGLTIRERRVAIRLHRADVSMRLCLEAIYPTDSSNPIGLAVEDAKIEHCLD
jgi:hypothetical protein